MIRGEGYGIFWKKKVQQRVMIKVVCSANCKKKKLKVCSENWQKNGVMKGGIACSFA